MSKGLDAGEQVSAWRVCRSGRGGSKILGSWGGVWAPTSTSALGPKPCQASSQLLSPGPSMSASRLSCPRTTAWLSGAKMSRRSCSRLACKTCPSPSCSQTLRCHHYGQWAGPGGHPGRCSVPYAQVTVSGVDLGKDSWDQMGSQMGRSGVWGHTQLLRAKDVAHY